MEPTHVGCYFFNRHLGANPPVRVGFSESLSEGQSPFPFEVFWATRSQNLDAPFSRGAAREGKTAYSKLKT
jgi:hypothetical protein